MKKTFLSIALIGICFCGFSQTVTNEKGKAYQVVPAIEEKKIELTKEEVLYKRDKLKKQIASIEQELEARKSELESIEETCKELGYK